MDSDLNRFGFLAKGGLSLSLANHQTYSAESNRWVIGHLSANIAHAK